MAKMSLWITIGIIVHQSQVRGMPVLVIWTFPTICMFQNLGFLDILHTTAFGHCWHHLTKTTQTNILRLHLDRHRWQNGWSKPKSLICWWCLQSGKTGAKDWDWDYCSPNPQTTRVTLSRHLQRVLDGLVMISAPRRGRMEGWAISYFKASWDFWHHP